jgi:hypothetical protein
MVLRVLWLGLYIATQKRRAEAVRKIHEILNHPSDAVLGFIFDTGAHAVKDALFEIIKFYNVND